MVKYYFMTVVTICTTRFNTEEIFMFQSVRIRMLYDSIRINSDYVPVHDCNRHAMCYLRGWCCPSDTHMNIRCSLWSKGTEFLGAFAKLRKVTTSIVMSVLLSVCPYVRPSACKTTRLSRDGYAQNLIFEFFSRKSVEEIQISLKSNNNNRHYTWRPICIFDHISLIS